MKKLVMFGVICAMVFVSGCVTHSTVTYFDDKGNVTRIEDASSDIVAKITASTKDKSILAFTDGWFAGAESTPNPEEGSIYTVRLLAGKRTKAYIAICKEHQTLDFDGLAKVIAAMSKSLTVSTKGIGETPVNK